MIKSIKILLFFLLIIAPFSSTKDPKLNFLTKFPNNVLLCLAPYLKLHELIRLAKTCKTLNKKCFEYHSENGTFVINGIAIPQYIEVHVTKKYFYFFELAI